MDDFIKDGNPLLENREAYLKSLERNRKTEAKKRFSFIFGLLAVVFSLIGFGGCILTGVNFIKNQSEEKKSREIDAYNEFLVAVAAVDPSPFDDITAASSEELIEIAVWSIIGADMEPDDYDYSSGELALPVADVEAAYTRYFGTDKPVVHTSVTGYGYEFSYNAEKGCYFIPLTAIEPFYTPKVTDAETKGDSVTLTVGLINSNVWKLNSKTGELSQPEPDKFIKVTLRTSGGAMHIGAIRSTNLPETAIVDVNS